VVDAPPNVAGQGAQRSNDAMLTGDRARTSPQSSDRPGYSARMGTGPARRGPYHGKRVVDLVVVAVLAVPAVLVGTACAVAVACTSRGPVLFHQERVGRDGRLFTMLKFRTMRHDDADNPVFPARERITRVGAMLRRLSLDELPQLLNVIGGSMSIVGPRPTLQYQVDRYVERQRGRLAVRPGLTGLAQVSGRNALSWPERIELDLEYVQRQSAWLDVLILARTVGAMISGSGVEGHPVDDPIAADHS
jgi:lipopolysaccharide/colanic/teichoic acid biosynthesis glycosyltransferase